MGNENLLCIRYITCYFTVSLQEKYVPMSHLVGGNAEGDEPMIARTYSVNLIVVVVLSSMSGVLSIILIVAIIRIKRQVSWQALHLLCDIKFVSL